MRVGEAIGLGQLGPRLGQRGALWSARPSSPKAAYLPLAAQHARGARRVPGAPRGRQALLTPLTTSLLVAARGKRLIYEHVLETFHQLLGRDSGVGAGSPNRQRLHDFRHSFAVKTLMGGHATGETRAPAVLSTYSVTPNPVIRTFTCRPRRSCSIWRSPGSRPHGGAAVTSVAPTCRPFSSTGSSVSARPAPRPSRLQGHVAVAPRLRPRHRGGKIAFRSAGRTSTPEMVMRFLDYLGPAGATGPADTQSPADGYQVAVHATQRAAPRACRPYPPGPGHPPKRYDRPNIGFLTPEESGLVDRPDQHRWEGRHDGAPVASPQTGLRVAEFIGFDSGDVSLGDGAYVRCPGKGRKHRRVPLGGQPGPVGGLGHRRRGQSETSRCSRPGPAGG